MVIPDSPLCAAISAVRSPEEMNRNRTFTASSRLGALQLQQTQLKKAGISCKIHCVVQAFIDTFRSLNALPITLTELNAMAAAAIIGDKRMPNTGYKTPAAIGTPAAL